MSKEEKIITQYIENAAEFAQPILNLLRAVIHEACPEVEEKIKWSFPHFDYKGEMMCSFAAFKNHCAFGFWKASLLEDMISEIKKNSEYAMGDFGRITTIEELPDKKVLKLLIIEAMRLNDEGIKLPPKSVADKIPIDTPKDFELLLNNNKVAKSYFDNFAYSHKKEYIMWFDEAKTDATRQKRMNQALEWISEGKGRNWKYEKKR